MRTKLLKMNTTANALLSHDWRTYNVMVLTCDSHAMIANVMNAHMVNTCSKRCARTNTYMYYMYDEHTYDENERRARTKKKTPG